MRTDLATIARRNRVIGQASWELVVPFKVEKGEVQEGASNYIERMHLELVIPTKCRPRVATLRNRVSICLGNVWGPHNGQLVVSRKCQCFLYSFCILSFSFIDGFEMIPPTYMRWTWIIWKMYLWSSGLWVGRTCPDSSVRCPINPVAEDPVVDGRVCLPGMLDEWTGCGALEDADILPRFHRFQTSIQNDIKACHIKAIISYHINHPACIHIYPRIWMGRGNCWLMLTVFETNRLVGILRSLAGPLHRFPRYWSVANCATGIITSLRNITDECVYVCDPKKNSMGDNSAGRVMQWNMEHTDWPTNLAIDWQPY